MSYDFLHTFTGKRFYPTNPHVDQVDIVDIGWALSHKCRFSGHSRKFYSVAQHSVIVSNMVSPENRIWALLHDASEAYMGDIVSPVKKLLPDYIALEQKIQNVICDKFGLPHDMPRDVKKADADILVTEMSHLMHLHDLGIEEKSLTHIDFLGPSAAFNQFMRRFNVVVSQEHKYKKINSYCGAV